MRIRPLHQRVDNALLRRDAAEMVAAALGRGFVVENRRMAGVRDKIGDIVALWQMPGKGARRIEANHHRATWHLVDDLRRNRLDRGIGHRQQHNLGPGKGCVNIDAIDPDRRLQPRPPGL